jgi:hypothetical protein
MKQISSLIRTFFRRPIYIKKDSDKREYLGIDDRVPVKVGMRRLANEKMLRPSRALFFELRMSLSWTRRIVNTKMKIESSSRATK